MDHVVKRSSVKMNVQTGEYVPLTSEELARTDALMSAVPGTDLQKCVAQTAMHLMAMRRQMSEGAFEMMRNNIESLAALTHTTTEIMDKFVLAMSGSVEEDTSDHSKMN